MDLNDIATVVHIASAIASILKLAYDVWRRRQPPRRPDGQDG